MDPDELSEAIRRARELRAKAHPPGLIERLGTSSRRPRFGLQPRGR